MGDIHFMAKRFKNQPSRKKQIFLNILLVLFSTVFMISAYLLVDDLFIQPHLNQQTLNEIGDELDALLSSKPEEEDVEVSSKEPEDSTSSTEEVPEGRLEYKDSIVTLQEKYPELVGWLVIDGTIIEYPVMKSSTQYPEYYLYRNYKGEYTGYGSIFHDVASDVTSDNQLLHGHNMLDGSMFAILEDFYQLEVYQNSPVIYYDTYEENAVYKIISVYKTNVLHSQGEVFDYFQTEFLDEHHKLQFIYETMNRSYIDTGVDVNENDQLLTLSTCSYEFDEFRTVVVARKVREGEDETVDVSNATLRDDIVFPQIWYNNRADSDPNFPETFEEAHELGLTDWWYNDIS